MDNIRYRIESKFADVILFPSNAIEPEFWASCVGDKATFITLDDVVCKARWICTWRNTDGQYDDELETICQGRWNVPFVTLRSMWISRLNTVDEFWHLVKFTKVG